MPGRAPLRSPGSTSGCPAELASAIAGCSTVAGATTCRIGWLATSRSASCWASLRAGRARAIYVAPGQRAGYRPPTMERSCFETDTRRDSDRQVCTSAATRVMPAAGAWLPRVRVRWPALAVAVTAIGRTALPVAGSVRRRRRYDFGRVEVDRRPARRWWARGGATQAAASSCSRRSRPSGPRARARACQARRSKDAPAAARAAARPASQVRSPSL